MSNEQVQTLKYTVPLIVGTTLLAWKYLGKSKTSLPLPPGPPGKPLIGNALDIPTVDQGPAYQDMARAHNTDIVHLSVFGKHIVVLCSYKAVHEVMERQSALTADRIWSPMAHGLMGFAWIQGFVPYNDKWRRMRKTFHPYMRAEAIEQWNPLLIREAHTFLRKLLTSQENITGLVREFVASMIMKSMYGITIKGKDDPYVTDHEDALELINGASLPGAYLVDIIPALQYVPAWMPGAGFQHVAARARQLGKYMTEKPLKVAKDRLV